MLLAKLRSENNRDPLIAIIVSVIICSVLIVYPLSYAISGARPLFMLLVMLFWIMCQPTWCGIWFAFATGIFTDLLVDAPLGMNALTFVMITFIARFLTRERRILTFANLWVISFLAVLAHLFMTWIAQIMGGMQFSIARHWQPLVSSVLVFPVIYFMLRKWRV
ncbi:rod shape-determining protein MreD [Acinetobacter terrae]|jgi:rod shape-determining protein MreD|uniref:Rod shape-determining protein MreD n=1 Tax=Acinetobacter terrae TaxID=2731247 RepID=A0A2C9WSD5_9GAMM|nr:rod shape-determining protein MreD [Acinetobacter terrae]NNG75023.1 rod shape-determining protein MreD [Acinetobacter terrae]NNH16767.1 rod shape-determining protein MreD [Acinetobacter terrae]NNH38437.1 rod shape-determining protein MreD [Acinetobacter terrae]OAL85249.1 rod shape-determining protein MreD [Acinetobacter terrae]OTG78739.1 rod shape-determining protein MreD [Acinetobacter terrae]